MRANFPSQTKTTVGLFGFIVLVGILRLSASEQKDAQLEPATVGGWIASCWNPAPVLAAIVSGIGDDTDLEFFALLRAEDNPAKIRIEVSGDPLSADQKLQIIEALRSERLVVEKDSEAPGDTRFRFFVWAPGAVVDAASNDGDDQFIGLWLPFFPVTQQADAFEIAFGRALKDSGLSVVSQTFERKHVPPATGGGIPIAEVTRIAVDVEGSFAEVAEWLARILRNQAFGKTIRLERMTFTGEGALKARANAVFDVPFLRLN
jgi:hypothetical protein